MKVTHYIYCLSFKGAPFYIGISCNPAARLVLHFMHSSGVSKVFCNNKNFSLVSITILEIIKTKSFRKCNFCHSVEQKWIRKYLAEGHKLSNIFIANGRPDPKKTAIVVGKIKVALDGRRQKWLADRMGVTEVYLSNRMKRLVAFTQLEIDQINEILQSNINP